MLLEIIVLFLSFYFSGQESNFIEYQNRDIQIYKFFLEFTNRLFIQVS